MVREWKLVGTIGKYVILEYLNGKHILTIKLDPETSPQDAVKFEEDLNKAYGEAEEYGWNRGFDHAKRYSS